MLLYQIKDGGQIIYSNLDSPWRLFKMTNRSEISHWAWCNISELFAERANFNFQLGILRDLIPCYDPWIPLQWYHNARGSVSNHQRLHRLLNCWFRRTSKKTPKLRVTGLCAGNSPVTGEFPHKRLVTRNVSIWWRHHVCNPSNCPWN